MGFVGFRSQGSSFGTVKIMSKVDFDQVFRKDQLGLIAVRNRSDIRDCGSLFDCSKWWTTILENFVATENNSGTWETNLRIDPDSTFEVLIKFKVDEGYETSQRNLMCFGGTPSTLSTAQNVYNYIETATSLAWNPFRAQRVTSEIGSDMTDAFVTLMWRIKYSSSMIPSVDLFSEDGTLIAHYEGTTAADSGTFKFSNAEGTNRFHGIYEYVKVARY